MVCPSSQLYRAEPLWRVWSLKLVGQNPRHFSLQNDSNTMLIRLFRPPDWRAPSCAWLSPPPCLATRFAHSTDVRLRCEDSQRLWQRLEFRSWQCSCSHRASRPPHCPRAALDGYGGVEPVTLQQLTAQQLAEKRELLTQQVTTWLDDEWLPQAVHQDLGDAAAEVWHCALSIAIVIVCRHESSPDLWWRCTSTHSHLLQAYARQRKGGEADMGSILLAVVGDLQAFNFHDTFTDPFEVELPQISLLT